MADPLTAVVVGIVDADYPFALLFPEDGAQPDSILRSSDCIDFHVHKAVLSLASPFFSHMFSFPQPPASSPDANEMRHGRHVVALPESSASLRTILLLCYPKVFGDDFMDLNGLVDAYHATDKYLIPRAAALIKQRLLDGPFITEQPYRVFAIGCILGLHDVVHEAALSTLALHPDPPLGIPEFSLLPASNLLALQLFRLRCARLAVAAFDRYTDAVYSRELDVPSAMQSHVVGYGRVWWQRQGHDNGCGLQRMDDLDTPGDPDTWPAAWFCKHLASLRPMVAINPLPYIAREGVSRTTLLWPLLSRCTLCAEVAPADLEAVADEIAIYS
ncbi:hypothetical protein C8J57DRAFT_1099094 [Mycena rebaudengoi]|nr:hypothetical protein C8J57DRAFT_1099094 [Mycena rebaudengoi]